MDRPEGYPGMEFTGRLVAPHGMYRRLEGAPWDGLPQDRVMLPIDDTPEANTMDRMRRFQRTAALRGLPPTIMRTGATKAADLMQQRFAQEAYMERQNQGFEHEVQHALDFALMTIRQDPRISWNEANFIVREASRRTGRGENALFPAAIESLAPVIDELGHEYNRVRSRLDSRRELMLSRPEFWYRQLRNAPGASGVWPDERLTTDPDEARRLAVLQGYNASERRQRVRALNVARKVTKAWRNKVAMRKLNDAMNRGWLFGPRATKEKKEEALKVWDDDKLTEEDYARLDAAERRYKQERLGTRRAKRDVFGALERPSRRY